jgi:divalent metal cation (Fe/Co/Zn/Cd) transporter
LQPVLGFHFVWIVCGGDVISDASITREELVRRGQRLEYFTVGWNSVEALVSIIAGLFAGSVALVGFGLDSLIEVASGAALLWRLHHDFDPARREGAERTTLRVVGLCFIALAAYIVYESGSTLMRYEEPERSIPGIVIAVAAVIGMPILAKAKRHVAFGIGSGAMHADSRQTDFCAYLSAILLSGLVLNAVFGWWWADPVAGLVMVPIIGREGMAGLRGKGCRGECGCH